MNVKSIELVNKTSEIVVIVPVYRQVEMTQRAILAAMPEVLELANAHLLAINDASPDEGMQVMLEACALRWPDKFTVLKNTVNLGFVGTVNRGLAYFPKHDVVLLNSDVVVANNWLTRLANEAYQMDNIGTVTPFSNNATICSFPKFIEKNNLIFKLKVDEIDAIFNQSYLPCVAAPTGVGFCMYIRRACLDEIGVLNEEKFGRGYGEENDLCQRSLKKGWQNLISPNIYAYHEGEVSFGDDKQALVESAMQVIDELHPNYHADVQKFIQQDGLKLARLTRYIQVLASIDAPKVLHISHGLGGGIGQYINELETYYQDTVANLLIEPQQNSTKGIRLSLSVADNVDTLFLNLNTDYKAFIKLLESINVSCVHFHQTVGHSAEIFNIADDLDVPHIISIHDFYWLAGNPTLTDEQGHYPGAYSENLINPLYPLPDNMSLQSFRKPLIKLFAKAKHIIFPSYATQIIFANVYEFKRASVAYHLELNRDMQKPVAKLKNKKIYTIGVLGALSREKGADILEALAVLAKTQNLTYQFKLLGYAYRPLKDIDTTGVYQTEKLSTLIKTEKLDMIFFPAQWPETYSYTLSYALDAGLPIIAPELGAFPERLSGRVNSLLFAYPADINVLATLLTQFIDNLNGEANITAPVVKSRQVSDFYQQQYRPLISKQSGESSKILVNEGLIKGQWLIPSGAEGDLNQREKILAYLWYFYSHDAMQGLVKLIPFRVSRFIKRMLSRRPLHDIIK